jgi:hypothetical protein
VKSTFLPDRAIVEFTNDDWAVLMMIMGYALGATAKDRDFFLMSVRFVNALNRGNPSYTPYEEEKHEGGMLQ